jgi:hypothetical protein
MMQSLIRIALIMAFFGVVNFGAIALADDPKTTANEQQTKEVVIPILTQITSRNCPEVATAEASDATKDIKDFKREIPPAIQQLLEAWLSYSKWYRRLYLGISISVILFGALAAALQDGVAWWARWKTAAAVLATVAAGANTTLAPGIEYRKFDDAFVVLNTAKAAYMTNPNVTLCDVGKAVASGESVIHKGE